MIFQTKYAVAHFIFSVKIMLTTVFPLTTVFTHYDDFLSLLLIYSITLNFSVLTFNVS